MFQIGPGGRHCLLNCVPSSASAFFICHHPSGPPAQDRQGGTEGNDEGAGWRLSDGSGGALSPAEGSPGWPSEVSSAEASACPPRRGARVVGGGSQVEAERRRGGGVFVASFRSSLALLFDHHLRQAQPPQQQPSSLSATSSPSFPPAFLRTTPPPPLLLPLPPFTMGWSSLAATLVAACLVAPRLAAAAPFSEQWDAYNMNRNP